MLTHHLIGAAHNAAVHTPQTTPARSDDVTTRAEATQQTSTVDETPRLQLPKRAELSVAVLDTIPDAVPESIYAAKTTPEPGSGAFETRLFREE
jgi:hypothetical protein